MREMKVQRAERGKWDEILYLYSEAIIWFFFSVTCFFPALPDLMTSRRCQSNGFAAISNQSNAIERDRTVEIRLSNAIKSQSNGQILGDYSIGSIEIRLCSIEILRSIAFDLGSIMFNWDLIALRLIEFNQIAFDISTRSRARERKRHG